MKLTFSQVIHALDAGRLEMKRPQGDWVRCRRAAKTYNRRVKAYMENMVETYIDQRLERFGYPDCRIASK